MTAAFVLVAALSAGLLAVATYGFVRQYRLSNFDRRAGHEAELALALAPAGLDAEDFERLVGQYEERTGVETLAVRAGASYSSSPTIQPDDVPESLVVDLPPDGLASADTTLSGHRYLVLGGRARSDDTSLYFFFSQEDLYDSLRELAVVLAAGWVITVAGAAAIGQLIARRTLRPVRAAAEASRSLAEGLLETRLAPGSDDEFGMWANSFNRMAEALQATITQLADAADRERRFTSDVAHELKTPLTGMVSAASLLEDHLQNLPDAARRPAALLVDDVRRLRALVGELLELARLDVGSEQVAVEPLSLRDALDAVLRPWRPPPEVDLVVDVDVDDGITVFADRARFRRVLANLVSNAADHGGGHVRVTARRHNNLVAIDVVDNGPGIAAPDLPRVFDRFFKADASRAGGSGLGLAIAREHALAQGGDLTVRNVAEGGACFTLRLPAAAPDRASEPGDATGPRRP